MYYTKTVPFSSFLKFYSVNCAVSFSVIFWVSIIRTSTRVKCGKQRKASKTVHKTDQTDFFKYKCTKTNANLCRSMQIDSIA